MYAELIMMSLASAPISRAVYQSNGCDQIEET